MGSIWNGQKSRWYLLGCQRDAKRWKGLDVAVQETQQAPDVVLQQGYWPADVCRWALLLGRKAATSTCGRACQVRKISSSICFRTPINFHTSRKWIIPPTFSKLALGKEILTLQ